MTSSSAYTLTLIGHQVEDLGTGRMIGMYMDGTYSGCVLSLERALPGSGRGRARAVEREEGRGSDSLRLLLLLLRLMLLVFLLLWLISSETVLVL